MNLLILQQNHILKYLNQWWKGFEYTFEQNY